VSSPAPKRTAVSVTPQVRGTMTSVQGGKINVTPQNRAPGTMTGAGRDGKGPQSDTRKPIRQSAGVTTSNSRNTGSGPNSPMTPTTNNSGVSGKDKTSGAAD
jgi:hypothetical protein